MNIMLKDYVSDYENALLVKFFSQNWEGVNYRQNRAGIIHKTENFFSVGICMTDCGFMKMIINLKKKTQHIENLNVKNLC